MNLRITVSFKNNPEEFKVYQWLMNKSAKAGYIKDLLKREMEREIKNVQKR